jgi:AcrR family transcriptional regulator
MPGGRPREFDENKALERAMEVFWRHGYEGATLPALTKAMGINRPSLYAAFGSKEGLFRRALDRYVAGPADYVRVAMAAPTAREVVKQLLNGAVKLLSDPAHPHGCLLVQGALACGAECDAIGKALTARRATGVAALAKRLEKAKLNGDLPKDADAAALACYFTAVIYGLAVQAAGGATRKELQAVANVTLDAAILKSR